MSDTAALTFLALTVPGFTACAEFGSYAFVHSVIKRLPIEHHVAVEQGLVRTFGRVMPVLMPASLVVLIVWAGAVGWSQPWVMGSAVSLWALGLITTVVVNVRINLITARWAAAGSTSDEWRSMRERWELFQAIRSWAFLASFLLVCVAVAAR